MATVKHGLQTAGRRRVKARAEAKAQSELIAELARQALAEGMSKSEIAAAAQISRPALDTMLGKK